MTKEKILPLLYANVGKRVLITWDDGITQEVTIANYDDEGFVHSGPFDGTPTYWTRFESVKYFEPIISN